MYQHIMDDKRASLSSVQVPRNGFCSTAECCFGHYPDKAVEKDAYSTPTPAVSA